MSRRNKTSYKSTLNPLSNPLVMSASASGLIYLFLFTIPFPLSTFYNTIPPVDYTKLTGYSQRGFFTYVFGIGALFGLYIWAIRATMPKAGEQENRGAREQSLSIPMLFVASLIFAIILIFSYPLTAIDLFIYAIRTRGWALYGLPPLATPPETLPSSDPWLGLAGEWVDAASPYGPLWEWLSLGAFHLSGGDFLAHLFALKIIGAVAYLGCVWLVSQILQHHRPDWAIVGTIAFAWSPLVLFESVQNSHNDIVMAFFLLAAVWVFGYLSRSRSVILLLAFCLFLALSILVKFVTIIVVPFFLLALAMPQPNWPRRLASIMLYGSTVAVMVILPMLAVWPGWENWAVLQAGSHAGRSLLALLILGLRNWLSTNIAFDLSRNLILFIFGLIYLYCLWRTITDSLASRPVSSPPHPATSQFPHLPCYPAFLVLFWYVLLAAPVFHAWYLLWFLPLAPLLLPRRRPLTAVVVFSITALLIIPYFETIRVWYPALLRNHFLGHLIGVPLLILPPAIALLWPISSTTSSEV